MLDYRLQTFLVLCKTGSYTAAARELGITQPAVTQHIRHLEAHYGCKLFVYTGRQLHLSEKGAQLREQALRLQAGSAHLLERMRAPDSGEMPLVFGATLTIGEYIMPPILTRLLLDRPELRLSMPVGNTQNLAGQLLDGTIQFALIEGNFDTRTLASLPFSSEHFVGVCAPDSPLVGRKLALCDLLGERLVLREKGSGTRDIFEHALQSQNRTVGSFAGVLEVGNLNVIKQLVQEGMGITFLYRAAVQRELAEGSLRELDLTDFMLTHQFHFVYLRDTLLEEDVLAWYRVFRQHRDALYGDGPPL